MSTIWKYNLSFDDWAEYEMPLGAEILDAQMQGENAVIWALVEPDNMKITIRFKLFPSGHVSFDASLYKYIATLQYDDGSFVHHLFEVRF